MCVCVPVSVLCSSEVASQVHYNKTQRRGWENSKVYYTHKFWRQEKQHTKQNHLGKPPQLSGGRGPGGRGDAGHSPGWGFCGESKTGLHEQFGGLVWISQEWESGEVDPEMIETEKCCLQVQSRSDSRLVTLDSQQEAVSQNWLAQDTCFQAEKVIFFFTMSKHFTENVKYFWYRILSENDLEVHLMHLPSPRCQFPGCTERARSRCTVEADLRLWHSWPTQTTHDPREIRLASGSLLTVGQKMCSLGLRLQGLLAFCLWLSHTCLSASREGGLLKAADLLSSGIH